MLTGLLSIIASVIVFLLKVLSWVVVVYVIAELILPRNKYVQLAAKYIEPILAPIRAWLNKVIPALSKTGFDFSPVALWIVIEILIWVLGWLI